MRVNVFSAKGVKTESKLELPEKIFEVKPNPSALRQYIHVYQKTQRAGTVATKTRGEVSGGGRKPWAQKGTGRARHGSVRSPIWVGGGATFGPQPREFKASLPKQMKDLALRLALSAKAAAGGIYVIEDPVFKEPKTSQARDILAKLKASKPLVVFSRENANIHRSFRNLAEVATSEVGNLNPYAVLKAKEVVFFKESIGKLKERLNKEEIRPVKIVKAVKAKKAVSRKPKAVSQRRKESK